MKLNLLNILGLNYRDDSQITLCLSVLRMNIPKSIKYDNQTI